MRKILVIWMFLVALGVSCAPLKWENIADTNNYLTIPDEQIDIAEEPHIFVKEKSIYLITTRPITVTVYNILGNALGQNQLDSGVYRLELSSRGIYLIKAGSKVIRVTI